MNIRHPLKPGQLALGKMPRPGLDLKDRILKGHGAGHIPGQFLIADGFHGLRIRRNANA